MTEIEQTIIESPTLQRLEVALAAGEPGAVETFWENVTASTTPLIEPVEGEPDARLVTFLWRADGPTENVVHAEWFTAADFPEKQFSRIGETDVWYRTLKMRSDVRVTYGIIPNDSLVKYEREKNWEARFAGMKDDPLNPQHVVGSHVVRREDTGLFDRNVAVLPDAAPFVWSGRREEIPHGEVTHHRFASALLGNERDVWLYTPPVSGETTAARLLVHFDGDRSIEVLDIPNLLDNLLSEGAIQPTVAVMIGNVDRGEELPCNAAFASFIADEVIPWVRGQVAIAEGPQAVVAAGQSYGGLAATWCGLTRPDAIGNILSQSGSFWWKPDPRNDKAPIISGDAPEYGWLPQQVATWETIPVRIYMEAGRFEARNSGVMPSLLSTNRHMRDVLIAKGYDVTYSEYAGGHDYVWWKELLAPGLIHLAG
ncbi:MAG TPA: alpha/beta hydrolase-fold protein [Thermomicrobiales bacterium]|nr:alpha/beta hydrolase-fold protein [Thermomicrobiales bacterium]